MARLYWMLMNIVAALLPFLSFIPIVRHYYSNRKNQVYPTFGSRPIWIHCASLGEFEQGRMLIELLKTQYPKHPIFITFFSSSGYSKIKSYKLADWVGYLPIDTKKEIQKLLQTCNPGLAIFIRYEYWYTVLNQLEIHQIPYVFVASKWWPEHFLLRPWNAWLRKQVLRASIFFVQDEVTRKILSDQGAENIQVTGDTRLDRVLQIKDHFQPIELIEKWKKNRKDVLIAGSTWPEDETIIELWLQSNKSYSIILAPHDISHERIQHIEHQFTAFSPVRYSSWDGSPSNMIVVDSIGLLNKLYAYGQMAYIGGGFGQGIHNTLEAAVYGIPVVFGPNYKKFKEAHDLIDLGAAISIQSAEELSNAIKELTKNSDTVRATLSKYFEQNAGASQKIIDYLRQSNLI